MYIAVVLSILTLYALFSNGFQEGCLSVSLPDLSVLTGSTTDQIAAVYTWRNIAAIGGSILIGKAVDRYNGMVVLGLCTLLQAIFIALTPWCSGLLFLYFVSAMPMFFTSGITAGTFALIFRAWSNQVNVAKSFVQGIGIVYTLGLAVSPMAVSPFLGSVHRGLFNVNNTNESTRDVVSNSTSAVDSQVHIAFAISGLVSLFGSVGFFSFSVILAFKNQNVKFLTSNNNEKNGNTYSSTAYTSPVDENKGTLKKAGVPLALHLLYLLLYGGLEMTVITLTMTYAEMFLNWSVTASALSAAVLNIARTVSSLTSVFLTNIVYSFNLLIGGTIITFISALIWSFCFSYTDVFTWLGIIFIGLGTGPLFPTAISVANDIVPISGTVAAYCNIAYNIGGMVFPPVAGYLLEHDGKRTFPVLILTLSVVCLIIAIFCKQYLKISKSRESKSNFLNKDPCETMPLLGNNSL